MTGYVESVLSAANANVITEDGLLLRTCKHDVRHPVAHAEARKWDSLTIGDKAQRHERRDGPGHTSAQCCGCCDDGERIAEWIEEQRRLREAAALERQR